MTFLLYLNHIDNLKYTTMAFKFSFGGTNLFDDVEIIFYLEEMNILESLCYS